MWGSAAWDRGIKRHLYQHAGVMEYRIVDLDSRVVERWRPDDSRPEILREVLTWVVPGSGTPFDLALTEFRPLVTDPTVSGLTRITVDYWIVGQS